MSNRRIITNLFLPWMYFMILTFFGNYECYISNAIMSIALYITINYIYDYERNFFSSVNFLCTIGLYIGIFTRYFVCIINEAHLTEFAPYPLASVPSHHIKTSMVSLIFIFTYAAAYTHEKKKYILMEHSSEKMQLQLENQTLTSKKCVIAYLCIQLIVIVYKLMNIRLATELSYGTFDQFFRLVSMVAKFFAYTYLYLYSIERKNKTLILYLIYIIPTLYLAIVSAWKGSIFFEIIVLCIVFNVGRKRIKKRYIIPVLFGMFFVFPIISMIRESYIHGTDVSLKFSNLLKYNLEHDFLYYYIKRLPYYDGLYYAINVDPSISMQYKKAAGSIIARFFSGLIPRALWHDKPIVNVGSYVTYVLLRYSKLVYNNLTVGFLADAYLDSKVLGVSLSGYFYGLLVGKNEKNFAYNKNAFSLAYYLTLWQALFNFWEGDIAAKSINLIFVGLTYAIAGIIVDKFKYTFTIKGVNRNA